MIRTAVIWASLLILGLSATSPDMLAQGSQTGSVTGTIRDATGAALSSATVTIAGSALIGGLQRAETDLRGEYRLIVLPPGVYDVVARASGFTSVRRHSITLPAGATLTVDFDLPVASVIDTLTVHGQTPMVDVKSPSSPARIDQEMLHHLPTSRNPWDLINLAPGIAADVSFGGSQRSNALFVEGLTTTESLFQEPLMHFAYNWVEEVQIVALGAGADYGGFTGVAANSILRSGGNLFSGLGEIWTTQPSWVGRNTGSIARDLQEDFAPRQVLSWWDTSAQLGGPVARDRVWFFSGLQSSKHKDQPAGFIGSGARDERDTQFLFKLSSVVTPNLRIEGFMEAGRDRIDGEYIDRYTPIEASNVVDQPQGNWNAHVTWVMGSHTVLEARHSGFHSPYSEGPRPPATRLGPSPHYDNATGRLSGNASGYFDWESNVRSTSVSLAHRFDHVLGRSHDLKFGVEYETTAARQQWGMPGGRTFYDFDGAPDAVYIQAEGAASVATRRGVLFAQDSWTIADRLTLAPGMRIEMNRGRVPLKGPVFSTSPVSPRIGVAWDVRRDHKTVVRGHYGRYHDTLFASRVMFADKSEATPAVYASVVGPDQFVELNRYDVVDNFAIDPNLRHSFVDQYVIGIEQELFADFSVQAQYIKRNFDVFMGMTDIGGVYDPVQRRDPGSDSRLGTADDGELLTVYDLTNPGSQFLFYTNPKNAFNRYNAMQVVAKKRYSRNWQVQASYTWSRNEGTVGNRWHVNAARFDLGSPGRFVNPNGLINAFGRATYDPTHEVKVLGTYSVPFWGGVNLSSVYRYTTGQAWGRRVFLRGLRQGGEFIRIEPVGTRRLPATNSADIRIEKTMRLRQSRDTLGLFMDVFNVTNQGVANSINDRSGTTFGQPSGWVDPRLVRAGVRFSF